MSWHDLSPINNGRLDYSSKNIKHVYRTWNRCADHCPLSYFQKKIVPYCIISFLIKKSPASVYPSANTPTAFCACKGSRVCEGDRLPAASLPANTHPRSIDHRAPSHIAPCKHTSPLHRSSCPHPHRSLQIHIPRSIDHRAPRPQDRPSACPT